MKLVHYSSVPLRLADLKRGAHPKPTPGLEHLLKPSGLWVSDDDEEPNWRSWCEGEEFYLDKLTHAHEVSLVQDHNVLILRSATELERFSAEFCIEKPPDVFDAIAGLSSIFLQWPMVMQRWNGIVITPYIWRKRLDRDTMWYYGWDCASGCIWEPSAIASMTLQVSP